MNIIDLREMPSFKSGLLFLRKAEVDLAEVRERLTFHNTDLDGIEHARIGYHESDTHIAIPREFPMDVEVLDLTPPGRDFSRMEDRVTSFLDAEQEKAWEALRHADGGLFSIPGGRGKCVGLGTWLYTDQGIFRAEDAHLAITSGEALFLDSRNGPQQATRAYRFPVSVCRSIETQLGYQEAGTLEHPLVTLDPDTATLNWTMVGELKEGDYVALATSMSWGAAKAKKFKYARKDPDYSSTDINLTGQLSRTDAIVLGLLVGDGGLTVRNRTRISTVDPDVLRVMRAHAKAAGVKLRKGTGSNCDYEICSCQYKAWLEHHGLLSVKSENKTIPVAVLRQGSDVLRWFLQGYFTADGGVIPKDGVTSSSASERLSREIQQALLALGILAKVRKKKTTHLDAWEVGIRGGDVIKFAEKIGFCSGSKGASLATLRRHLERRPRNSNIDVVPVSRLVYECAKEYGQEVYAAYKDARTVGISRPRLREFLRIVRDKEGKKGNHIRRVLESLLREIDRYGLRFLKVTKLQNTVEDVVDFTVPNGHEYYGNGFINHNTVLAVKKIVQRGKATIVILPTLSIISGWKRELADKAGIAEEDIGVFNGAKYSELEKPIVIASLRSLALKAGIYPVELRDKFGTVVFDEVHNLGSPTGLKVASMFRGARFGFTATPERADGTLPLYLYHLGPVIYRSTYHSMKPLVAFVEVPIKTTEHDKDVIDRGGKFNFPLFWKKIAKERGFNRRIFADVRGFVEQGRIPMVFTHVRKHAHWLHDLFEEKLQPTGIITGKVKWEKREKELLTNDLIVGTMGAAREGLNRLDLDLVLITMPVGKDSEGRFLQAIWRSLRDVESKNQPWVIVYVPKAKPCYAMAQMMRKYAQNIGYRIGTFENGVVSVHEVSTARGQEPHRVRGGQPIPKGSIHRGGPGGSRG